uniref:Uncharacterized protein n=1 Tax=Melopsittacus undulatus TaxID=13146 RepID=A0A8C6JM83_MELUD
KSQGLLHSICHNIFLNIPIFSQKSSVCVSVLLGNIIHFMSDPGKITHKMKYCLLAVVAAMKTLQEKMHRLQLEKSKAEDNLCRLSIAAAQYKKAVEHESYKKDTAHEELMQQRKDVSVQLNTVQSRCSLLEKQLDYMKKMVSSAELENKMGLEQQAQLQKEEDQNWLKLHAKLEKLEMLEKECLKLTATQRIAEDKIKRLEEKLCEEEHQRKLVQDKTAQGQSSSIPKLTSVRSTSHFKKSSCGGILRARGGWCKAEELDWKNIAISRADRLN